MTGRPGRDACVPARPAVAALVASAIPAVTGAFALLAPASARAATASVLRPESPGAAEIRSLAFTVLLISAGIFLVVEGLLLVSIIRFRKRPEAEAPQVRGDRRLEIVWTAIPAVIVVVLFLLTVDTMKDLDLPGKNVTVGVTGHQWWWEVRYPGADAVTANEIHVPVGRTVQVALESADVIHSFWAPQIGGKTDLIPGHVNRTSFLATTPGTYAGACAEFCGLQHAGMRFWLVVEEPGEFSAWLKHQAEPAAEPKTPAAAAGKELLLSLPCAGCHSVRGTAAQGTVGPDLTHLAGRLSLAAGTLPNTPQNLRRWLHDPQAVKPGNRMPTVPLTEEQLNQLTAYLEGLE
ncbi:MAG: cytochrome c oxidase subunit II [Actinobacteria bacterium]|nr:cytochrome c oxidase subunit II [Actinomycetota bacterium]